MPSYDQVNVLAELERIGWGYEWAGNDELSVRCPFHDDKEPSARVNVDKRVFKCYTAACGESGDLLSFLARALNTTRGVVFADLCTRYTLDVSKVIEASVVERHHQAIWQAGPLLKALYDRGVTDEMIRQYRLGEHKGRVIIPVKNQAGMYVNLRRYLPGAPGDQKMRNAAGRGKLRLYPIEQMEYSRIVLTGGEMKAIVGAAQLNQHGIGCVTATGGEGNWDPSLTREFKDKHTWVLLDIDSPGRKAAHERCTMLHRAASWVGDVLLPLNIDKYPHGDLNDFIAQEHGDLLPILEACPEWEPALKVSADDDASTLECDIHTATNADMAGRRVRLRAIATAVGEAPYVVPKEVCVDCDRAQQECQLCDVYVTDSGIKHLIPQESPSILEMMATHRNAQRESVMRAIGVPVTCKSFQFKAESHYNVEDARVSPQLEITNRSVDRVMQPAACIGCGLELNETYEMVGRMHPHPKTQAATLLISAYKPTQDALSTYQVEDTDSLMLFRPEQWTEEAVAARLDRVYADFEANVTRIYQRKDAHIAVDLAYHSPLFITFDGRVIKGWVEVLLLGDSAQGKTETAKHMMEHYNLGTKVECKNASVAGLLGGLQSLSGRWFVTWGVIPTHDKRLVILEELKGAGTEVISKLTDMRSSGIAEIPKIEKRRTHARTRLIALSNPRSDHPLSSYSFGIAAIQELVGGLEDVRRFDTVLLLGSGEVEADVLNRSEDDRPSINHTHTREACRLLILWAWTRKPEQVFFEEGAELAVMQAATQLCEEFTDQIPVVDRGSMRHKLARLSASIAARTFSSGPDMETLIVRTCHVQYVTSWLRRIYSTSVFGYREFTAAVKSTQVITDENIVRKHINETPFPKDFAKALLHSDVIDLQDIQDWCGWDRIAATQLLSLLVRKHALMRHGRAYRKSPALIRLVRDMLARDELTERPAFVEEEF